MATPLTVATGSSLTGAVPASTTLFIKRGGGTLSLNSASSHSGGTVVEDGAVVIQRADAIGTGFLDLRANTSLALATGTTVVDVPDLFFAPSAVLDIRQAGLSFGGINESGVRALVLAGRGGGGWDGSSGIRSTNAEIGRRTVGYMTDGVKSTVRLVAPGDSNLGGVFDILDVGDILSAGKFNTGEPANWQQGDVNYDGVLDILDISEMLGTNLFNQGSYLTQASATSAAVETGTVATFDPALVFAALAMDSGSQPTTKRKLL